VTFTAKPFFFSFLFSYNMAQYINIHIQNTSTRAIQKAHNCMMLVFSLLFFSFLFFLKGGERKTRPCILQKRQKDSSMTFQQRRQFFDQRDEHRHKNENDPFFFSFHIPIFFTVITMKNNSDRAHTNTLHKGIFSFFSKGTTTQQKEDKFCHLTRTLHIN